MVGRAVLRVRFPSPFTDYRPPIPPLDQPPPPPPPDPAHCSTRNPERSDHPNPQAFPMLLFILMYCDLMCPFQVCYTAQHYEGEEKASDQIVPF